MPSHARQVERQILEFVAPRYERDGFLFVPHPSPEYLPSFFDGYRPDAVAIRADRKIAFEIVGRSPGAEHRLLRVRDLFVGRTDWSLEVITAPRRPVEVPAASVTEIRDFLERVDRQGPGTPPSVVLPMLWSALEAAARRLDADRVSTPQQPVHLVNWLGYEGHVLPAEADVLRRLAHARDQAAHGGLTIVVDPADLDALRAIVENILELRPEPAES